MITPARVALFFGFAALLPAASITYNPAPTTDTGWTACANFVNAVCRTTAYFDALTLSDQNDTMLSSLFQSAWNAWNPGGWTLNFGGDLAGTYNVNIARALQFDGGGNVATTGVVLGGAEINVQLGTVTAPTLGANDQLAWVQGLFDNYLLNGTIVPGFYEMDITSAACGGAGQPWCPPAYPFQYNDDRFYDRPRASYRAPGQTQAFFDANAYLSVINYNTQTVTVYDGISYGWQNYVENAPEPGTWVLLITGMGAVVGFARRRRV